MSKTAPVDTSAALEANLKACPAFCGGAGETCFLDNSCHGSAPPQGCNAGGVDPVCRFCGFGDYPPCPTDTAVEEYEAEMLAMAERFLAGMPA